MCDSNIQNAQRMTIVAHEYPYSELKSQLKNMLVLIKHKQPKYVGCVRVCIAKHNSIIT